MQKDFNNWNALKKELNTKIVFDDLGNALVSAKVKDLWWCHVGVNIGSEEDGKNEEYERPVLILTKLSPTTYLVAPTTSKFKDNIFRFKISTQDGKFSFALIDQIRVIDIRRLKRKIGVVLDQDFINLNNLIYKKLLLNNCEIPLARDFSEPFGTV